MSSWSDEIKELDKIARSFSGRLPELENELFQLIKANKEVVLLLYSRRSLEILVRDICERENINISETIPLKGIIDKINKEKKAPSNIITAMLNLNSISTYGAHPKEFDTRQVKTAIINLITIIAWYSEYIIERSEQQKPHLNTNKVISPKKRKLNKNFTGYLKVLVPIVILILIMIVIFNKQGILDITLKDKNENSIAVLPFESFDHETDETPLANALPIALIMEVQNIEGFVVRPWNSTLRYKEVDQSSYDIGKELKVDFLLKGYLQKQDKEIIVDIMFINVVKDEVIWNRSFHLNNDNLMETRSIIAKEVAKSLKLKIKTDEKPPTENPDAYMAYLTGLNAYWGDQTEDDLKQSIYFLKRATELDPNFFEAYIKLSSAYSWSYHFYYDRRQECLDMAEKAFNRAQELRPGDPNVYFVQGIYYYCKIDYQTAKIKYKAAHGKVFDLVEYNISLASLYRRLSRLEKAFEFFSKALEMDPQNKVLLLELAETTLMLHKFKESETYFNQASLRGLRYEDKIINPAYLYLIWEDGIEKSKSAMKELMDFYRNNSSPPLKHLNIKIDLIGRQYDSALQMLKHDRFDLVGQQFIYRPYTFYMAEVYSGMGDQNMARIYYDSARIHLEKKIAINNGDSRYHSILGIVYAGIGRKMDALREAQLAEDIMPIEKDFYLGIFIAEDVARIYTMTGAYKKAFQKLDKLLSLPGLMTVNLLKKDPVWEPLWDLPGFKKLIEKYSSNY